MVFLSPDSQAITEFSEVLNFFATVSRESPILCLAQESILGSIDISKDIFPIDIFYLLVILFNFLISFSVYTR